MKKLKRKGNMAKAVAFALSLSLAASLTVSTPVVAAQGPVNQHTFRP